MAKIERINDIGGNMTMRKLLPDLYGRHIRIGYSKGTSFVFMNVVNEQTEDELAMVAYWLQRDAIKQIENAKSKLKVLKQIGLEGWLAKQFKEPARLSMERRMNSAENYFVLIKSCERTIEKNRHNAKRQGIILDDRVVDIYPSIDPETEGHLIIILDGDINGKYWIEKEYLAGHVPLDDGKEEEDDGTDEHL